MKFLLASAAVLMSGLALLTEAHISFRYPCPRRAPYWDCPQPGPNEWNLVDYNVRSPLGVYGSISSPFVKWPSSFAGTRPVFKAGETVQTKMDIGALHNGGSCQWALSYDNGNTFVVIQDLFRTCMSDATSNLYTLPVKIPSNAPSGKAIFAWIWNNNAGNRELYASMADVVIDGVQGGSLSGVAPLLANYGPNSPLIKETALAGGDWGKKFFDARPAITVQGPSASVAARSDEGEFKRSPLSLLRR